MAIVISLKRVGLEQDLLC